MAGRTFQAVYYRAGSGSEPVRAYVDRLSERHQAILLRQVDRLNMLSEQVPHLPFPYSSQVKGELRELRCHIGSDLYRVLYRRSDQLLVLLHIFRKKTKAVPQSEIETAQRRWRDFKRRMDAERRVPPRAAGRDAP